MIRTRLVVPLVSACAVALLGTSCGGDQTTAAATPRSNPLVVELPSKVLGLTVKGEDIRSKIDSAQQPYIDSVGLFGFRERSDLLDATLEVARFTAGARSSSGDFRGSIVSRIGGANPRQVRVGDQQIYLTSGRNQVVFIWFKSREFFVLTVRRDYPFPRTLARKLIDLKLG